MVNSLIAAFVARFEAVLAQVALVVRRLACLYKRRLAKGCPHAPTGKCQNYRRIPQKYEQTHQHDKASARKYAVMTANTIGKFYLF